MKYIKNYYFYLLFIVLFPISFVSLEHRLYFWDLSGYWNLWQDFSILFKESPKDGLYNLFVSVRNDDYNQLPIALLSIFNYLPIDNRISYILSIVLVYFVPTIYLIHSILSKLNLIKFKDRFFYLLCVIMFPAFWSPILRGYPDIVGLIFILLAIRYIIINDFSISINIKKAIILGIFLWMPFVLRRWYAYTIISLYATLPILNYYLNNSSINKNRVGNIIFNFFISGIVSILLSFLFQKELIIRIISTNYSSIYSAYQQGIFYSIDFVINSVGVYFLLWAILGIIIYLYKINNHKNIFLLFCILNLLISGLLFFRTQTPGIQHNLPFSLWLFFLYIYGMISLIQYLGKHLRKTIFIVILGINLIINAHTFFNFTISNRLNNIFPTQILPLQVNNYDSYIELAKTLKNLIKDSNDQITIFASGNLLNSQMLDTLTNRDTRKYIINPADVDLRDLINVEELMTKYVVVTSTVQTHLPIDSQQVIVIPNDSILNNKNIGKAYKKLNYSFILDNGVTAYIYQKERAFTYEEIREFFAELYKKYPSWEKIYNNKLTISYLLGYAEKGDIWGDYRIINNQIYTHPGENYPTKIFWNTTDINEMVITSSNTTCNIDDTIRFDIIEDNKNSYYIFLKKGSSQKIYLKGKNHMEMIISKVNSSYCDGIYININ